MLCSGDWMSSAATNLTWWGRLFLAVVLPLIAGLQYRLWVGEGSLAEHRMLADRVEKARIENDRLTGRNRLLLAEIRELKTGLESVEDRARSELGMIRKGETFYLLVEAQARH